MTIHAVETVTEARKGLPAHLATFREKGSQAGVTLIGSHRKPEAALIPIALFEQLMPMIDELQLEAEVAQRIATQASRPLSELAAELGMEFDD